MLHRGLHGNRISSSRLRRWRAFGNRISSRPSHTSLLVRSDSTKQVKPSDMTAIFTRAERHGRIDEPAPASAICLRYVDLLDAARNEAYRRTNCGFGSSPYFAVGVAGGCTLLVPLLQLDRINSANMPIAIRVPATPIAFRAVPRQDLPSILALCISIASVNAD